MIQDNVYMESLKDSFEDFDFQKCDSSNVFAYAYNEKLMVLIVAFKAGKIYQYSRVKPSVYNGLQKAESKGKFINEKIVHNSYKFRKYEIREPNKK